MISDQPAGFELPALIRHLALDAMQVQKNLNEHTTRQLADFIQHLSTFPEEWQPVALQMAPQAWTLKELQISARLTWTRRQYSGAHLSVELLNLSRQMRHSLTTSHDSSLEITIQQVPLASFNHDE